jgi:hypothetical protein
MSEFEETAEEVGEGITGLCELVGLAVAVAGLVEGL